MGKGNLGHTQGDMKPVVEDYQMPTSAFAGKDMNRTTEYISRNDACQTKMANDIKKQDYKGKY